MSKYEDVVLHLDPPNFMSALLRRLKLHEIKLADLARKAGMTQSQLSRYVTGRTEPSMETMLRLDEAADKLIYG